ncbi:MULTISPECIES: LamB/YcsF family protein [unclassified Microcella]|uniref:LamB/YcsF family protein n=1 Tax=unclassified Microcella TaxID=2630066 RepID=UPI0006FFA7AA|nr:MULTISPECIES: 5-oxoprolinase subunit PxpA [unclassified Microcella]KQV26200.1 hypothetical protein ASC54_04595 [Yonghaparkia sp. Root332]KRF33004.1 hypothetical protein ASG83_03090 [Yonghaparkia sp. Soil809]
MPAIDLNSDLGESWLPDVVGDDEAMLALVSSANLACGAHGGDPTTMAAVCRSAAARGVVIGAHPSYDDRAGFGRRHVDVAPEALDAQLREQVARLAGVAAAAGGAARYLKPHGALYNRIVRDAERAEVVARVAAAAGLPVMGMPGSAIERAAREAGIRFVAEAFVDRGYRPDGSLVPRSEPGAVLHDVALVAARAVRLAVDGSVVAVDGSIVRVEAESLCVHGDTPGAVAMARAVREALAEAGVDVRPVLGAP